MFSFLVSNFKLFTVNFFRMIEMTHYAKAADLYKRACEVAEVGSTGIIFS